MPPFAKPPVVPRPFREVTDTSVMALSAVHDSTKVLDQARARAKIPKRKIRTRRSK